MDSEFSASVKTNKLVCVHETCPRVCVFVGRGWFAGVKNQMGGWKAGQYDTVYNFIRCAYVCLHYIAPVIGM
jgi:hypothetical protein